VQYHYPDNTFTGLDISENLFNQAKVNNNINLVNFDLTKNDLDAADVYISVFTLQFLPINIRYKILRDIYTKLPEGGCLIIAEKVFLDNGKMQDIFSFSHYDYKEKTFSASDIFKKQKDLRRIMKPLTESENLYMLNNAGFRNISTFWQNLLFKAWLCIK